MKLDKKIGFKDLDGWLKWPFISFYFSLALYIMMFIAGIILIIMEVV